MANFKNYPLRVVGQTARPNWTGRTAGPLRDPPHIPVPRDIPDVVLGGLDAFPFGDVPDPISEVSDLIGDLGVHFGGSSIPEDMSGFDGIDQFGLPPGSDVSFVPPPNDVGQTRETAGDSFEETTENETHGVHGATTGQDTSAAGPNDWVRTKVNYGGSADLTRWERQNPDRTGDPARQWVSRFRWEGAPDITPDPDPPAHISARGMRTARRDPARAGTSFGRRRATDGPGLTGPAFDAPLAASSGNVAPRGWDGGFTDPSPYEDWSNGHYSPADEALGRPAGAVDESGMVGPLGGNRPRDRGTVPGLGWSPGRRR